MINYSSSSNRIQIGSPQHRYGDISGPGSTKSRIYMLCDGGTDKDKDLASHLGLSNSLILQRKLGMDKKHADADRNYSDR
ncbi:hypothetical protein BCON_0284g00090 [Botryotinia convoluta]|uniref:Uncharacterized protein n=1 Tax=Botryotinia convoluta TaxID=54673 RepID=A0A4Z1HR19_9HELO|nr:hypothetical protein BCON_0284g00090 [Botryotinia convoluta]